MVCSFFFIVLPMALLKVIHWLYCYVTGKKVEDKPAEKPTVLDAQGNPVVKKGTCPYHVVMNFLGFEIPKKEAPAAEVKPATTTDQATDKTVKAE